ncbi:MAG TPA: hypothetical protein PKA80_06720 [Ignavibacteriaceae bacterium]|nr:hypothetical protein [Ignavibacteriaceae bacterium]
MSLYTIVFIGVAFLVLLGLALFFIFVNWLSNKIDKSDRLGQQTKKKNEK